MHMIVYTSKKGGGYLVKTEAISQSGILPQTVILIDPSKTYQTHWGFGASFTESAAAVLRDAGEQITAEAVAALFSREGNGYTLGRLHINSCDFSSPCRMYLAEHDETLASFDLSYDKNLIVPLVKAAERACGNLFLTAAPWSPPAFMKDNRSMLRGGKLLKKYYPLWAEYLAAYVGEMQKCGVKIGAINVQNEPEALQPWESCLYTASEEGEMIKELACALKARGLDTKIAAVDHKRYIGKPRRAAVCGRGGPFARLGIGISLVRLRAAYESGADPCALSRKTPVFERVLRRIRAQRNRRRRGRTSLAARRALRQGDHRRF